MGIHKTTYLVAGMRLSDEELRGLGYTGVTDDRLLPYVQGHEGVELSLLYGEDLDGCVVGIILAQSSYDGEDECRAVDVLSLWHCYEQVLRSGLAPQGRAAELLFVELWG